MYGRIGHRLPGGFYGSVGAPIREFSHGLSIFAFLLIMGALVGIAAITPWIWVPLLVLVVIFFTLAMVSRTVGKPKP